MKLRTTYTPYHPSFLKSAIYNVSTLLLLCERPEMHEYWALPMIGCSAHDLYAQHQYNNKLTKTVELKLEGEKETRIVDMKPNFMDSFTEYSISGILGGISSITVKTMSPQVGGLYAIHIISIMFRLLSQVSYFFSPDKAKYTFTDQKTGELISEEEISAAELVQNSEVYIN
jgi:hypothetical protein